MRGSSPIPTPPGFWWREFRIKVFPMAGFLIVLGLAMYTWRAHLGAPSIVGEVEAERVDIISTVPGLLAELHVDRFDCVSKDDVVCRIYPVEPHQLKASIAALEIDLKVLKARMDLDRARNGQSLTGLRTELELERLTLDSAHIQLEQAEKEFQRSKELVKDKVMALGVGASGNDYGYDVAVRDRDRILTEIASHKKTVAELETAVKRLEASGSGVTEVCEVDPLIEQAIAAQRNKLLLLEGPIELRAPISGVVSMLSQRGGTRVMAGVPILSITPAQPQRIIGYVRQPLNALPRPGERVEVRTRSQPRQIAYAQVLRIGPDLQPVTSPMRVRGFDNSQERGLPFLVSVPEGIRLLPGELVDLRLVR